MVERQETAAGAAAEGLLGAAVPDVPSADVPPAGAAAAIRRTRQNLGISLRELARRIGVSPATVSGIETGRTALTVDRLHRVAAALGVRAADLVRGTGPADPAAPSPTPAPVPAPAPAGGGERPGDWRVFAPLGLDPVLTAAIREFVATGYHGATVRSIAAAAAMSVPGVYHHYPSKQHLLVAVLDATMNDLCWRVEAARDSETRPANRFARMVEALALFHAVRRDMALIGAGETRGLEEPGRSRVAALRRRLQYLFDDEAAAAVRDGSFTTPHVRDAARAVSTMCTSLPQWFSPAGPRTPEAVAREYAEFALAMMAPGGR